MNTEKQPVTHKWYCDNPHDSSPWCEGCGVLYRPELDHEICPTPDRHLTPAQIWDRKLVNRGYL